MFAVVAIGLTGNPEAVAVCHLIPFMSPFYLESGGIYGSWLTAAAFSSVKLLGHKSAKPYADAVQQTTGHLPP